MLRRNLLKAITGAPSLLLGAAPAAPAPKVISKEIFDKYIGACFVHESYGKTIQQAFPNGFIADAESTAKILNLMGTYHYPRVISDLSLTHEHIYVNEITNNYTYTNYINGKETNKGDIPGRIKLSNEWYTHFDWNEHGHIRTYIGNNDGNDPTLKYCIYNCIFSSYTLIHEHEEARLIIEPQLPSIRQNILNFFGAQALKLFSKKIPL